MIRKNNETNRTISTSTDTEETLTTLKRLLESNEEWLMARILDHAIRQGYSAYASTLKEAWRMSISGLSASIIEGIRHYRGVPEMTPDDDFLDDPITLFGTIEAQRHRERGISLTMFLGLMKYYRQSYIELIRDQALPRTEADICERFIERIFDRIEIAFCAEWAGRNEENRIHELQVSNRLMTNEKNKYLTIFESIPNPVIILNQAGKVDNMNVAAASLFEKKLSPGSQYYCLARDRQMEMEQRLDQDDAAVDPACFGG